MWKEGYDTAQRDLNPSNQDLAAMREIAAQALKTDPDKLPGHEATFYSLCMELSGYRRLYLECVDHIAKFVGIVYNRAVELANRKE